MDRAGISDGPFSRRHRPLFSRYVAPARQPVAPREIVILHGKDLRHRPAILAQWKANELASPRRARNQLPCQQSEERLPAMHHRRIAGDQVLLLRPADLAKVAAGELEAVVLHDARTDEPVAEAQGIVLDIDDHDVRQQVLDLFRRDVAALRQAPVALVALLLPIGMEPANARRGDLADVQCDGRSRHRRLAASGGWPEASRACAFLAMHPTGGCLTVPRCAASRSPSPAAAGA